MTPKWMYWTGWVVSLPPALLLLMSAGMKFAKPPDLATGFEHLGWPIELALTLGVVELVSVVVYLLPPTATFGAILLTGYLGGAIATHLRVGDPPFPSMVVPIVVGIALWGGLWLSDARLRALVAWSKSS